jgi:hypothetical protein
VQDGVIIASPARVVAVVEIVRQHMIATRTLQLSNEARTHKTAQLYSLITSQRCTDLFARFDTIADDLLEMQVKERKSHDDLWKKQGTLFRSVKRVAAEISAEIDGIIGATGSEESAP